MERVEHSSSWDPAQYSRFDDERTRPATELLARVPLDDVIIAADLGCGTGNSTEPLTARWPSARIIGVDSSPQMLAEARAKLPAVDWIQADVADWIAPASLDLIFSNAALHWVAGHRQLLPRLLHQLRPGGFIAIQMPNNFDAPSHALMRSVALRSHWHAKLSAIAVAPRPIYAPETYYGILSEACSVDIWQTEYLHVLKSAEEIVEWVRGTGLRPYLEPLSREERDAFLDEYRVALTGAYPVQANGKVLFPFRRLFIVAQNPI